MAINRHNIGEHLMEKQLSIIGKTMQEAIEDPLWKQKWFMNESQFTEFERYSIPLLKKVFKCNKTKAKSTFDWFRLQFGIPVNK